MSRRVMWVICMTFIAGMFLGTSISYIIDKDQLQTLANRNSILDRITATLAKELQYANDTVDLKDQALKELMDHSNDLAKRLNDTQFMRDHYYGLWQNALKDVHRYKNLAYYWYNAFQECVFESYWSWLRRLNE